MIDDDAAERPREKNTPLPVPALSRLFSGQGVRSSRIKIWGKVAGVCRALGLVGASSLAHPQRGVLDPTISRAPPVPLLLPSPPSFLSPLSLRLCSEPLRDRDPVRFSKEADRMGAARSAPPSVACCR
jgi:hypothetical protein